MWRRGTSNKRSTVPEVTRVMVSETAGAIVTETVSLQPLRVGFDWYAISGWDTLPALPSGDSDGHDSYSVFPPPDGARVSVIVFPPQSAGEAPITGNVSADDVEDMRRRREAVPAGGTVDRKRGQHSTDTVDVGFVISGEIELECGEKTVTLKQGAVLVQMGTLHAWRNRGKYPCTMGFVLFGTRRQAANLQS